MAFRIENRIGIAAPAPVVWEVLADLPRWGEWNTMYPEVSGRLAIGETLSAKLVIPGEKPETVKPVILDWVPNEQLVWNLKVGGGLIRTTRWFEIEALTEEGSIVSNGELFQGLAAGLMPGRLRGRIRQGFADLNEALKTRAEGRWAGRSEARVA